MFISKLFLRLVLTAPFAFASFQSYAQSFPTKAVRGVVAFGAGGQTDAAARIVGDKLAQKWGQSVTIENRPGANGNIGTEIVTKAPADGHTIYFATQTVTINKVMAPVGTFDPMKDLAPVSLIGIADFVLAVHPSVPANSVDELVAYAKANPGKLNYGATSYQSTFVMEQFNASTGIKMERIAYTQLSALIADLLTGRIGVFFAPPRSFLTHIESGKLKALAISGTKRSPMLPNVPNIQPVLPSTWYAVLVPANTPASVINRISADVKWAVELPDVRQRFEQLGVETKHATPEELGRIMREDVKMVEDLVRRGVIKVNM